MKHTLRIDDIKTNEQILCDQWVENGSLCYILNTLAQSCRDQANKSKFMPAFDNWESLAIKLENLADQTNF